MAGNVADIILTILADWGVKSIYGVSGDAIFPLLDAISRQNRIKYYCAATEAGAAFMAGNEAKLTGRPGVCVATSGPGAVSLLNGLADAFFDRAPVVAITGQVTTKMLGSNSKQYINQQLFMNPFTSKSELVVNPEAAIPVLISALETAINKKSVVNLSFPKDVFTMPVTKDKWPAFSGHSYNMGSGFANGLEEAASQLNNAQKPLFIIGERNREIREMVLNLAEKTSAGIIIAQQAKGVIPDSHPLTLGGIGEGYVPSAINQSDLVVLIGNASFDLNFLPVNIPLIQLADVPDVLSYNRIDSGIIGNIGQLLKLLNEKISHKKQNTDWLNEIINEKQILWQQLSSDAQNNQIPIHPARLMAALNKTVAKDAIIASDIGSFMHWFDRGFQAQEQVLLLSSYWRSMGSGVPAAISAKIAFPEKQVLALVGDGGLLMSMGEFMTAVKYSLPITVLTCNNQQYQLENNKMAAQGMNTTGNDITVPDFAAFANAAGAKGFRVENSNQLENTINEALNCGSPAIVDIQMAAVPLPIPISPVSTGNA